MDWEVVKAKLREVCEDAGGSYSEKEREAVCEFKDRSLKLEEEEGWIYVTVRKPDGLIETVFWGVGKIELVNKVMRISGVRHTYVWRKPVLFIKDGYTLFSDVVV